MENGRAHGGPTLLNENDTDGRMAILMVTGYAQGPLCQRITEKRCQTVTRTMPYLQQGK